MSSESPRVTVSLAVHDGMRWLPGCLDSVAAQTVEDLEILIIDDASTDGSLAWLRERARTESRIDLEASPTNLGYARAQNRNIRRARGTSLLLLNQDVVLDPGFIAAALAILATSSRVGAVQGRLRRLDSEGTRSDILDSTGLIMHRDRHATIRGHLRRDGADPADDTPGPVWGVDGPAPLVSAEALRSARLPASRGGMEVFDEDFFMYKEDVDLAWRLRRLGWEAWYEPTALAWHARTGGGSADRSPRRSAAASLANSLRVRRLSYRNQRLMQVKNEPVRGALPDLPMILLREVAELGFLLLRDPARLRIVPSLMRELPWAMRKRLALTRAIRSGARAARRPGLSS